ncbi:S-layer homology domain-containing protein [Paenibacillus apis]|uniref:SLH domain-containing protein n=1 Tax=Paenibacillus apis TaxID=1792174 RepID=A0A919Y623_9BACL|nr:S-layer homology domain-containing protein [Paenibacillus apis]GIO43035.1 hypothetical protein J41TS4_27930 [Paenibacillus apis]
MESKTIQKRRLLPVIQAIVCLCLLAGLGSGAGVRSVSADGGQAVFKDTATHWARPEIEAMVSQGILDGYPDGSFRPTEPVKVDQFVKMLILSFSEQHPNQERSWRSSFLDSLTEENRTILKQDYRYFDFKPAMTGYWAKPYIDVASDLNFLNKSRYSDFQANMTRENVAELIYYTLQETEYLEDAEFSLSVARNYGDLTSGNERMQRFIAESLIKGIMEGYPDGNFGVGRYVTRAEALVILTRLTDKSKRIPMKPEKDQLQRIVPASTGSYKIVAFPDQKMLDMYDTLVEAGKLRGTNYNLLDTTLRLFKDDKEKQAVLNASSMGNLGASANSATAKEEVALWLDPAYNTYGITVRLREGTLARNKEAVELFGNRLFTYEAIAFHRWFNAICEEVEAGHSIASKQAEVGGYTVNLLVDNENKTVVFSIATTK